MVPGRASSARTLLATVAANLALPLSAVATGPVLAHALGPSQRGELAAVLAPVAFATFLFHIGWAESSTYLVASRRWSPLRVTAVGTVLSLGGGAVGAAGVAALAPVLLHQHPGRIPLLVATASMLPVLILGVVLRGVHLGRGDFSAANRERWLSVLSRLVLIVGLAAAGLLSVALAAWVTTLTSAVAVVVLVVPLHRLWRARGAGGADRSLPWGDVLSYGGRTWVGSVSVLIMLRLDQVLMTPLTGAEQLGFYAVAVALAEVPAFGFGAVREVAFSRSAARGDTDVIAVVCRLSVLVMTPAVLVAVLLVPWGVPLVFGRDYAPAAPMTQLLLVAALPAGLSTLAGSGLMSLGRPGVLSASQSVIALVNVGLVLLLVPGGGGTGAAVASLATYCLLGAATTALFLRSAGLRWSDVLVPTAADLSMVRGLVRR